MSYSARALNKAPGGSRHAPQGPKPTPIPKMKGNGYRHMTMMIDEKYVCEVCEATLFNTSTRADARRHVLKQTFEVLGEGQAVRAAA